MLQQTTDQFQESNKQIRKELQHQRRQGSVLMIYNRPKAEPIKEDGKTICPPVRNKHFRRREEQLKRALHGRYKAVDRSLEGMGNEERSQPAIQPIHKLKHLLVQMSGRGNNLKHHRQTYVIRETLERSPCSTKTRI